MACAPEMCRGQNPLNLTCSVSCSFTYSLIPNKLSSSLRASNPWPEPEKALSCLGEVIPMLIFAANLLKSAPSDPPTRQARASVLDHSPIRCLLRTPTTPARRLRYPCSLLLPEADSRSLRRFAAEQTRYARQLPRCCGGSRALRARRLAPLISFSGLFLSAAL